MQVGKLQGPMMTAVLSCRLDGLLLAPLLRLLALCSLKLGIQPPMCDGRRWQPVVFERCQHVAVRCLEELDKRFDDATGASRELGLSLQRRRLIRNTQQ